MGKARLIKRAEAAQQETLRQTDKASKGRAAVPIAVESVLTWVRDKPRAEPSAREKFAALFGQRTRSSSI